MKNCRFCAEEILDGARFCKHCGKEQKFQLSSGLRCLVLIILAIVVGVLLIPFFTNPPAGNRPSAPAVQQIDKSAKMEAGRDQFIQKAMRLGLIRKVGCPSVWVTPTFMAIDFDAKAALANVVYAYCFTSVELGNVIRLRSSVSGKDVGTYSSRGLRMD